MDISEQAKQRKKKFLELKKQAGSFTKLRTDARKKQYRVYFDKNGDIITFTDSEIQTEDHWKTYDFKQEELQILIGKNINRYRVVKDPKVANMYYIEPRQNEAPEVDVNKNFLFCVSDKTNTKNPEIICKLKGKTVTVTMTDYAKTPYTEIEPSLARKKNKSMLQFYITAPNDPHMMFREFDISLKELLTNESVEYTLDATFDDCSLYTVAIFDRYLMAEQ